MTGRDYGADIAPIGNAPTVILVRPQLADNIGACARAMANGGLFHLRLVAPRDGWPQPKAWRNSSGADRILDAATVFENVTDVTADMHHVFATAQRALLHSRSRFVADEGDLDRMPRLRSARIALPAALRVAR